MWLTLGPDGALYVLDFYREVIETPLSLPDDIKKKYNLESRGRGRIWRVAPAGSKPVPMPKLSKASSEDLVKLLGHPNRWQRITAWPRRARALRRCPPQPHVTCRGPAW